MNAYKQINMKRLLPAVIAALGALAYANGLSGAFVFDDCGILTNANLRHFRLSMLDTSRPLIGLTFFFNYWLAGGFNPADCRAVNLLIHIAAGLTLFGIVRRTITMPALNERYGRIATGAAFAVACVWLVHPLQTESVTYISQRSESLMGLFYLLTLYCVIRGIGTAVSRGWHAAAVFSCALGMACKPVMVTAPFMALLYDRFFAAGSIKAALRARRFLYAGLAATWLVLAVVLSAPNESTSSTGSAVTSVSPLGYLATQPGVILRYLGLAFWPRSLCLDYAWPPAGALNEAALPGIVIMLLLAAVFILSLRRVPLGFVGLWFFVILAPTSSIFPIEDYAAEHRMYLPLAGIVAVTVLSAAELLSRATLRRGRDGIALYRLLGGSILAAVVLALCALTALRNMDYHTLETMMRDIIAKRPDNFRAHVSLISELLARDANVEAEERARRMLDQIVSVKGTGNVRYRAAASNAEYFLPVAHNQLGRALLAQDQPEQAIQHFQNAIMLRPDYSVYFNLSLSLLRLGRFNEAAAAGKSVVDMAPGYGKGYALLGLISVKKGNFREAISRYEDAVRLDPDMPEAKCDLARLLATCPDETMRDGTRAVELALDLCEATGFRSSRALDALAAAYTEAGNIEQAQQATAQALRIRQGEAILPESAALQPRAKP